ncbi:hypothetical protein [Variovorax boronicumulans]|uniref:hypothetical protein n=1 Tax=Variovorax boronicumulans TaxID=436515 RepID=UPI0012E66215|nr:hypothetical protein [Variovorax boronicumulans]GER21485.1 hypothetical protein VCH24_65420 [Variovorax boronicumulans]
MHWGIYARDGFEGAAALRQGFLAAGHTAGLRSLSDYGPCCLEPFDAIALFGLQGKGPEVFNEYAAAGVPVVLVDYGYMRRTNHAHDWRTGHWQISIGGLNKLPPFKCAPDRFDALGLEVKEQGGDPNGYILLCVQSTGDASHGMDVDQLQRWCDAQAARWPGLVVRPHPLERDLCYGLPLCPAKTLDEALAGARLVVTGNSNTGHDALMAGVPVIATVPGAAWDCMSGEKLPSKADRLAHFYRCAYGQWTWGEFRLGLPQRFLTETLMKDSQ